MALFRGPLFSLLIVGASGLWAQLTDLPAEPPEVVVQRAMEAQARGDVEALIAECAIDAYGRKAADKAREMVMLVRDHATISDLQVTIRSVGIGDQGNLALVRAETAFQLATADGTRPVKLGTIVHLIRDKDANLWKILSFNVDEFLNLEIYESQRSGAEPARAIGYRKRDASAVSLTDLNTILDNAMKAGYIDERHFAVEGAAAAAGTVPILGDGLAIAYKLFTLAKDSAEALVEMKNYGITVIAAAKVTQVAMGAVQVVTEPVPGVDRTVDATALILDHTTYNMELHRAVYELKQKIVSLSADDNIAYHPRIYRFGQAFGHKYDDGVDLFDAEGTISDGPGQFAFGNPLARVNLSKPAALNRIIPFHVIGEFPVALGDNAWEYVNKFPELGAVRRDDSYYLPVDLTPLVDADASEGDTIFDNLIGGRSEMFTFTAWTSTCRRGRQKLSLKLRNGEESDPIVVTANLMNRVTDLELRGAPNTSMAMRQGETWTNLRIFGTGGSLSPLEQPDLTNLSECLDLAVTPPEVLGFKRGPVLTVEGLADGSATLKALLGGSIPENGVPDVGKEFAFNVSGWERVWSGGHHTTLYNKYYEADVNITVETTGGLRFLEKRTSPAGGPMVLTLEGKPIDAANGPATDTYTIQVSIANLKVLQYKHESYELTAKLEFSPPEKLVPGFSGSHTIEHTRGKVGSASAGVIFQWCSKAGNCISAGSDYLLFFSVVSAKP